MELAPTPPLFLRRRFLPGSAHCVPFALETSWAPLPPGIQPREARPSGSLGVLREVGTPGSQKRTMKGFITTLSIEGEPAGYPFPHAKQWPERGNFLSACSCWEKSGTPKELHKVVGIRFLQGSGQETRQAQLCHPCPKQQSVGPSCHLQGRNRMHLCKRPGRE